MPWHQGACAPTPKRHGEGNRLRFLAVFLLPTYFGTRFFLSEDVMGEHQELQGRIVFQPDTNEPTTYAEFDLVRVKGKSPEIGIILSDDTFGTHVHFWGNSSIPHVDGVCRPCEAGCRKEWLAWVGFLYEKTKRIVVMELKPNIVRQLQVARKRLGTLRGMRVKLFRRNAKDKGVMVCQVAPEMADDFSLPRSPDVVKVMKTIWRVVHVPSDSLPSDDDVAIGGEIKAEYSPIDLSEILNGRAILKNAHDAVEHNKHRVNGVLPGQRSLID